MNSSDSGLVFTSSGFTPLERPLLEPHLTTDALKKEMNCSLPDTNSDGRSKVSKKKKRRPRKKKTDLEKQNPYGAIDIYITCFTKGDALRDNSKVIPISEECRQKFESDQFRVIGRDRSQHTLLRARDGGTIAYHVLGPTIDSERLAKTLQESIKTLPPLSSSTQTKNERSK
jgi:hypothetical protein